MDPANQLTRRPNPYQEANFLSALTFTYLFPIFRRTYKKGLTEDDLFQPLSEHKSSIIGDKLEKIWKQEYKKHKKAALHIALFKLFGFPFIIYGIIKLIDELMLVIVLPYSIGKLVNFFDKGQQEASPDQAYIYTAVIVLCLLVDAFLAHPTNMGLQHIAMKLRVACSSLIYRKTLRLSKRAMGNTTVGQAVNLLSNDVSKFDNGFLLIHYVWIGPIQTAVGTYLLYRELGIAAFFGIGFLLVFIPMQIWMGQRTSVLRLKTALRTDERVRLMNEVISGIQVIKMYCWEKPFAKLISWARRKEMKIIRQHAYLIGIVYSFEMFVTRASIFISVIGYVLMDHSVDAKKMFAVAAIYNVLRPVMTILFSISISNLAEVHVSVKRLHTYLSYDEVPQPAMGGGYSNGLQKSDITNGGTFALAKISGKPRVVMKNVCAKWSEQSPDCTLKNLNFEVVSNQLLAVIGPVGSGKSSLLNVILKELPVEKGTLEVSGRISFASQEPWLFAGTVRQNIVFNSEFDEDRYRHVVKVCALESDFALFPHGDRTLVGEKGKSLSGGQKARINLARCVYKQADIYLLDDPLSAVDANVGKHLFRQCVNGFLADKICLLITHQLQYLKSVDKILIMNDGRVAQEGSYKELRTTGLDFAKLLEEFQAEEEDRKVKSRQSSEMEDDEEDEEDQIMEKEKLTGGSIKMSVYWQYFRAGGGKVMLALLVASFLASQLAANAGDYYQTYWVNKEEDFNKSLAKNLTNVTFDRYQIIYEYTGITATTIFFSVVHSLYFMLFLTIASVNLHDYTFSKIIQATMRFYNNNPSGRILNRFSKDLGYIDEYIPNILFDVIEVFLLLVGVIVLSAIVEIWLLPSTIGLMVFLYFVRRFYIATSRCVKRIEGITRSPVFGHMTASMNGLSTIRAFSAEKVLISEFDAYQDCHSAAWYLFIASSRCFGFWLDIICIIFIAVATIALVSYNKNIYGGDIGLVITQYIGLIGSLQWGMRQWSELENQMTSVERVLEYTQVDTEPERKKLSSLPVDWPGHGKVQFVDVSLRYTPSDSPVLKNLSFTVLPAEKVGIVGRTGAGKSSTIAALFQLYEIEGSIFIDDYDATRLPLDDVRSNISIIPQEPVLFSGNMRKNLDPFEEYNDETLWNALEQVEMKGVINDMPGGLAAAVTEGGGNFSVGQRQLICLARALIRHNRILVLDEATANVDPHTDALIQRTIREKFASCTVLTIAHRLHTVMDSDKILVMSAGRVQEFDHPYVLLQKEFGTLKNLVEDTGTVTAKNLLAVARESYEKKKNE